jgi:hypothetical protein
MSSNCHARNEQRCLFEQAGDCKHEGGTILWLRTPIGLAAWALG